MNKDQIKHYFMRFNQLVLSFPIWIVLGVSGLFRNQNESGWQKSEKNEEWGKMY